MEWGAKMLIQNIARIIIGVYVLSLLVVNSFSEVIDGIAYMEYGLGARIMALGGASRAFSNDASSGYWNPAMLPKIIEVNFSAMNADIVNFFEPSKYNHYSVSIPFTPNDAVALNYVSIIWPGFEIHNNDRSNPEGYFNITKSVAMLSYGRKISDHLSIGVTGKYGTRKVYTYEDGVIAVDIGYLLNFNNLSFGGSVRNIYCKKVGEEADTYMMDADLGMLVDLDTIKIGVDVSNLMRGNPNIYAGIEYTLIELNDNVNLKCRVGRNTNNDITLGIGALVTPLNIDYAYLSRGTGAEQMFSVGLELFKAVKGSIDLKKI